jgi:cytochrome P450
VRGSIPFLGHALSLRGDILHFLHSCSTKYGNVFQIQIGKIRTLIVCDANLRREFFKLPETEASLHGAMADIYFGHAVFPSNPRLLSPAIKLIKKSVGKNSVFHLIHIITEAQELVRRLSGKSEPDMFKEIMYYVVCASSSTFLGTKIDPTTFEYVQAFTHLLNRAMGLTYILPTWVLHFLLKKRFTNLGNLFFRFMSPEVEKYRKDPGKLDSTLLRQAITEGYSDREISNIALFLLFTSLENTVVGLSSLITELAVRPEYVEKIREEGRAVNWNLDSLLKSSLLHAVVMENARLNTHPLSLLRKPIGMKASIGEFSLSSSDVDMVFFCAPLAMLQTEKCKRPTDFYPERFLNQFGKESLNSSSVMTWGSGHHLCAGKAFSILEMKLGLIHVLMNFDLVARKGAVPVSDYSIPNAFSHSVLQNLSLKKVPERGLKEI